MPRSLKQRQATHGPTISSRIDAIEALGSDSGPGVSETLAEVLHDTESPDVVRAAAARALGKHQRHGALQSLVTEYKNGIQSTVVSTAVLAALGQYPFSQAAHQTLLEAASPDQNVQVAAVAIMSLGGMRSTTALTERTHTKLRAAIGPSSRLWVRRIGLLAIRQLDDAQSLEAVIDLVRSQDDPLRDRAIRTLGYMGRHQERRTHTRELLTRWLYDSDRPTQLAAIGALGMLGDTEATPELSRLADSAQNLKIREAAKEAIESIKASRSSDSETVPHLRRQLVALEQRQQELQKAFDKLVESRDEDDSQGTSNDPDAHSE